jgi:DNA-binding NarL/FixJ family response regulator
MIGGTLLVSRNIKAHDYLKKKAEKRGFKDVSITAAERDGLNMVINQLKPRLVIIDCDFYECCTPFLLGRLLRQCDDLKIAVVSITHYPADLGMSMINNGVWSYISFYDGPDLFNKGFERIRDGISFISPEVEERMRIRSGKESPATEITDREIEVVRLFCNGYTSKEIAPVLQISKRTVEWHREELYRKLNIRNTCELVRAALYLGLINRDELQFYGGDYVTRPLPNKKLMKGGSNANQNGKRRIARKQTSVSVF